MSLLGSESGVSEDDPGATVMWFGKYQGKRLDELDIGYQHKLLEYAAETPAPNVRAHVLILEWSDLILRGYS